MTLPHPKKHAKELFIKCRKLAHSDWHPQTGFDFEQGNENAKQLGIVAIDECIDLLNFINQTVETPLTKHYLQMKEEIEKL